MQLNQITIPPPRAAPAGMSSQWAELLDDWALRFFLEMDYQLEAANTMAFKAQMAQLKVRGTPERACCLGTCTLELRTLHLRRAALSSAPVVRGHACSSPRAHATCTQDGAAQGAQRAPAIAACICAVLARWRCQCGTCMSQVLCNVGDAITGHDGS